MPEKQPDNDEFRIDFQQMLKDMESENLKVTLKDVRQADIAGLFKKKSNFPQDKNPQ